MTIIILLLSNTLIAQEREVGEMAPGFTLPDIQSTGTDVTLEDLRGQIVYVDFWASWCLPCLRSLPQINELYGKYQEQGFRVVAITIDSPVEDALEFLEDLDAPINYMVVSDIDAEIMDEYGVVGMPTSFLIDREGIIRKVHKGFREGDTEKLETELLGIL